MFRFDRPYKRGNELSPADQQTAKSAWVHRFTIARRPQWAMKPRPNGKPYMPHFRDDEDWLANTLFQVTASGRCSAQVSRQLPAAMFKRNGSLWPNAVAAIRAQAAQRGFVPVSAHGSDMAFRHVKGGILLVVANGQLILQDYSSGKA